MSDGSRPGPGCSWRVPAAALATAALLAGCGQKLQEQYGVQIIGPVGLDYLSGARSVALEVGEKEISRTSVSPGEPFDLTGGGIDPGLMRSGTIRVRAYDGGGALVAYGASPEIELSLYSPPSIRLFVQKPGTFGKTLEMDGPRRNLIAVSAVAAPPTGSEARPVSVAFFGTGKVTGLAPGSTAANPMIIEVPSDVLQIYNTLRHETVEPTSSAGSIAGVRQPRTDAAALVQADNSTIYLFGGVATPSTAMAMPQVTSQLDVLRIVRPGFADFEQRIVVTARTTAQPGVARSKTALGFSDATYAFGGEGEGGTELDTVVQLNPMNVDDAFKLLDVKMGAPRTAHTATTLRVGAVADVLVFGGPHADAAVAEVFTGGTTPEFVKPMGDAGPTRWNHAAVSLPSNRGVLIIGGKSAGGTLGSILLYEPATRKIGPAPVALKTPRSDFAAFVVLNDLVVAGGLDGQGQAIDNAEVFDISGGQVQPRMVVPTEKRSGAAATVLPNDSAMLFGGTSADGKASPVVEIYQPFRM
jgi:hypothetical protein